MPNNRPPTDFISFLRGVHICEDDYTEQQIKNAIEDACYWDRCYCSRLSRRVPRTEDGAPIDPQLDHLGRSFSDAMDKHYWARATDVIDMMRTREAQILAEMGENN